MTLWGCSVWCTSDLVYLGLYLLVYNPIILYTVYSVYHCIALYSLVGILASTDWLRVILVQTFRARTGVAPHVTRGALQRGSHEANRWKR